MDYINLRPDQEVDQAGLIYEIGSLYEYFLKKIHDPRKRRGKRYRLVMLLVLILLAKLGGEDKPSGIADWIAHRREQLMKMEIFPDHGAPSHMTYRRVFQETISLEEFEQLMREFNQSRLEQSEEIVLSVDGKTVLSEDEAAAFRRDLGIDQPALDRVIRSSFDLLGLISFYTMGEDECRAWPIRRGTTASRAAGTIHSDLEKGFIRAEVVVNHDLVACGSLHAAEEKGLLRLEGKDYLVRDGDVMHVRSGL